MCPHCSLAPVSHYTKEPTGNGVDKREVLLRVRINDEEKIKFEKLAEENYTSLSELIRQLLHREADTKLGRA